MPGGSIGGPPNSGAPGLVVVSSLPDPPNPAVQAAGAILTVWAVTVVYPSHTGLYAMPVCGPIGTPRRIVRTHAPVEDKVIKWIAQGWGGKPPLPGADTQCPNEVFARKVIGGCVAGKSIDGQDIYTVYGEYYYYLQAPHGSSDAYSFGCAPYQSVQNVTVYNLTPSDFNNLYVAPSASPAGAPGTAPNY